MAEVAEEVITTKIVEQDAKKEIVEKTPVTEEKSNDSQQASKKDTVIVKSKIQEIESKIKIEIERRQATSKSFPFLAAAIAVFFFAGVDSYVVSEGSGFDYK